jgi:hypothetical protein
MNFHDLAEKVCKGMPLYHDERVKRVQAALEEAFNIGVVEGRKNASNA